MTTEIVKSPQLKVDETKLNYLWLNGERVIGIEGLEIFEDCRQLQQLPAIRKEQRDELNSIINTTLERYAEEGICNHWSGLVTKAKEYFSEQGYCVIKNDKIKIDLRQQVEIVADPIVQEAAEANGNIFTVADLWNIHRNRRVRVLRRFL
jgi:hypothetical protein